MHFGPHKCDLSDPRRKTEKERKLCIFVQEATKEVSFQWKKKHKNKKNLEDDLLDDPVESLCVCVYLVAPIRTNQAHMMQKYNVCLSEKVEWVALAWNLKRSAWPQRNTRIKHFHVSRLIRAEKRQLAHNALHAICPPHLLNLLHLIASNLHNDDSIQDKVYTKKMHIKDVIPFLWATLLVSLNVSLHFRIYAWRVCFNLFCHFFSLGSLSSSHRSIQLSCCIFKF
jgi:hypothetical protein